MNFSWNEAATAHFPTTFAGGSVLKFPADGSGGLNIDSYDTGSLVTQANALLPAIFTSENDDTVGEVLP